MAFANNPKPQWGYGGVPTVPQLVEGYESGTTQAYKKGEFLSINAADGTFYPCDTNVTPQLFAIADAVASSTTKVTHERLRLHQEVIIKCSTTPTTANKHIYYQTAVASNVHTLNLAATTGGKLTIRRLIEDPAGTITQWVVAEITG